MTWAQSHEARSLIRQLQADPPTYRVTRGAWIEGGGQRRYQGPLAAKLRRLWIAERDRLWAQGEDSPEFAAHVSQTADQFIERLLAIEPAKFVCTERARLGRAA